MFKMLQAIDVSTAQYNAEMAHFDNFVIRLGVNGVNIGNESA